MNQFELVSVHSLSIRRFACIVAVVPFFSVKLIKVRIIARERKKYCCTSIVLSHPVISCILFSKLLVQPSINMSVTHSTLIFLYYLCVQDI